MEFLSLHNPSEVVAQSHAVVPSLILLLAVNALRFSWKVNAAATLIALAGYIKATLFYANVNVTTAIVNAGHLIAVGGLLSYSSVKLRRIIHRVKERDAFARFLPGPIVERLTNDPTALSLGGEREEATVLFADIRGFTTMSEKLEPEGVITMLNEYFQEMVDEIFEHQGILDKFIGDGILAVFVQDFGKTAPAERAVLCARGMLERLELINQRRVGRGEDALRIGVGIHSGKVIAGRIGSPKRLEYTHVGDTVNCASRIESMTKDLDEPVLISSLTYEGIDGDIALRSLGEHTIRGRPEPLTLYALA